MPSEELEQLVEVSAQFHWSTPPPLDKDQREPGVVPRQTACASNRDRNRAPEWNSWPRHDRWDSQLHGARARPCHTAFVRPSSTMRLKSNCTGVSGAMAARSSDASINGRR